ncbi:hypothetical protein D3C87_2194680 [compost metagenome]
MRTTEVPLQQRHATPGLAQKKRGGGTDNTAANDDRIDFDHDSTSRPNGRGLMGA